MIVETTPLCKLCQPITDDQTQLGERLWAQLKCQQSFWQAD